MILQCHQSDPGSLARAQGLSHTVVHRIWQAHGLQPHRVATFKLSRDPQFVKKLRDVVGVYLNPPDKALVFGVDEKPQIQALDRTEPVLPLRPGIPACHNRHAQPFIWTATAATILRKVRH